MENKPRKRQLSEEQPSGNGVKKPKVSVGALRTWLLSGYLGHVASSSLRGLGHEGVPSAAAGHAAGPGCSPALMPFGFFSFR